MIQEKDEGNDPDQLGIAALQYLGENEHILLRFLDLSGLDAGQLRAEATKPYFFVAVLDFILANEADLIEFAASMDVHPRSVGVARNRLAVKAGIPGENYPA